MQSVQFCKGVLEITERNRLLGAGSGNGERLKIGKRVLSRVMEVF